MMETMRSVRVQTKTNVGWDYTGGLHGQSRIQAGQAFHRWIKNSRQGDNLKTQVRMSIIQQSVGTNQRYIEVGEIVARKGTHQEIAIIQALGNEGLPVDSFKLLMACELPLSW